MPLFYVFRIELWHPVPSTHNERLPAPMELYYHGKHLATNSFEHGNKALKKERSNNFEIGIAHHGSRLHYKISAYHNRFANYIHNENLHRSGNLFIRRYNQAAARFSGLEGEIGFHITPKHEFTLFGDYVKGRLKKLPAITGEKIYSQREDCTDEDGDPTYCVLGTDTLPRHAARVPPARLGFRLESALGKHWTANLEYTRVFAQRRTSQSMFSKTYPKVDMDDEDISDEEKARSGRLYAVPAPEDSTRGYHLVNAGIRYKNRIGKADYTLSLDGNNLLNQKIYIHNSYLPYVPQMGRNFIFGVNVKF
ncbi:TonB-dependent receptor domain-containing protein [Neisseria sp. WLZKY-1]|uniref:TonB-dependent receptor domain-containing protein n=1 Tax=Neisseria sp. WLZKY-1 TaxID=3390377 RepID=UPI00397CFEB7